METYKIIHKEVLEGWYYVEAESEEAALEEFQYQCGEGKIDFSDMEMVDSEDIAESLDNPYFTLR